MKLIMVESVQVMPEEFIDTMGSMYQKGGNRYFDTFEKWLDWMYLETCGGLRFNKIKVFEDDVTTNNV